MNWARLLALLVMVGMILLGANIVLNGSLDEGLGLDRFMAGLADPWRTFIGFDLLSGLLLISGWIVWRQQGARWLDTLAWVLCLTWWGNVVAAAYILVAARQSEGDPARFFLGARAGALQPAWPATNWPARIAAIVAAIGVAGFTLMKIRELGLVDLAGLTYIPGFLPVVLAFVLLGFPAQAIKGD
jgi:hypothetical protein